MSIEPCEPEGHTFEGMTGYCDVCGVSLLHAYKDAAAQIQEVQDELDDVAYERE